MEYSVQYYPHHTGNHSDTQATITSIHKHWQIFIRTFFQQHTSMVESKTFFDIKSTHLCHAVIQLTVTIVSLCVMSVAFANCSRIEILQPLAFYMYLT